MTGFRVYIDEAGDEGFVFRENGDGSSHWFVVAAAITRTDRDAEDTSVIQKVRVLLGRQSKSELHFRDLKHEQRLPLVAEIAQARVRAVVVAVHKPSLDADVMSGKGVLYRYAVRLLLERVSWLCREARLDHSHTGRLIFSDRSNTSYDDLRKYLAKLREKTNDLDVRIDWTSVECDDFSIVAHEKLRGLQIADTVASSALYAVRLSKYGQTDPSYITILRPILYRRKDRVMGYGLKLYPPDLMRSNPLPDGLHWLGSNGWK